jgi:hypothetical protein
MKIRKLTEYILLFILLVSCNQTNTKNLKQESTNDLNNNHSEKIEKIEYKFENSVIPRKLIEFINDNLDSLRIPSENDYELKYFKNRTEKQLPFYCSGQFNEDSSEDYAIVLIKDSMNHYVFSFHSLNNSFEFYKLASSKFSSEHNSKKKYVVFELSTETERELEAIDTTYVIKTDAINISNIYESRTSTSVWNSAEKKYELLLFD